MKLYRISRKRRPVLVGRKVKCIGEIYYDLSFWNGIRWDYREYATIKQANDFLKSRGLK